MKKKVLLTSDLHYGYTDNTHNILGRFYGKFRGNIDYVIIAGDIISHEQSQWDSALKLLRSYFDCPILTVLGNHDLWQSNKKMDTIWSLKEKILSKFKLYDITYLPSNPLIEKEFKIYGFDGWYGKSDPPSRDLEYMPDTIEGIHTHEYLKKKAKEQLEVIPNKDSKVQQIVVTHFDFNAHPMSADSRWLDILNKKADILCVGHSHQHRFETIMDMQIINPGSDYDKPDMLYFYGGWL